MAGEVFVDSAAVRAAVAQLDGINESLHAGSRVVRDEVFELLGSGWSGSSASFYSQQFDEFSRHAAKIVEDAARLVEMLQNGVTFSKIFGDSAFDLLFEEIPSVDGES